MNNKDDNYFNTIKLLAKSKGWVINSDDKVEESYFFIKFLLNEINNPKKDLEQGETKNV